MSSLLTVFLISSVGLWAGASLLSAALVTALVFCLRNHRLQSANPPHRLTSVFNSVADGLFSADASGHTVFANASAARMLGAHPDALLGRPLHALLHEYRIDADPCGEHCRLRLTLDRCESISGIETFYRLDGSSFSVELTVTPLVSSPGNVDGTVVSFRDITKRQEMDRLKAEFVSTVSHELRTPLTSIRGALGLLSSGLMGDISSKATDLLRIAVSNTDRLVRLINDLLDLERMASGRAPLHLRHCALDEIIQHSIETVSSMADAAKVKINATTEAANLDADPDRIQQVLTNLLSNAIKFSPAGSVVEITPVVDPDTILLKITDQGRGIPDDKLEAIFDRFQQLDAADSKQKGGSGLGLAICRSIVQQHGGRIWADHNPLGGSVLNVLLPRTQVSVQSAKPLVAGIRLKHGANVLVCDDDEVLRSIVGGQLRLHGYNILEADRGEQVIALATETQIDVILLDLYMPGISGWETLQRLRNNPSTAQIPVVILSVLSPVERPSIAGNAAGWVQKPYHENLLLNELSRVLHKADGPSHILLVEDDADFAQVLTSSFEAAGINVDHALTRTAALHYFEQHRPDMVILDLTLPDGDGFSLVDWMRQHVEFRTLPLVVYSGHEVTGPERHKLSLGPTEFITKARVQPQDVEALVLTMLRQFREAPESTARPADVSTSL
jgi:PAS domain S-box-containing protein